MSHDVIATDLVAGTWNVDPSHSEVAFTVRHLMSKVRGTFADFAAEITTGGSNPTDATVSAVIKLSSINTNNAQRDGHIKSADFFDPATGSEMTFVSTGISENDGEYVINGDLTINGVTKGVALAADFLGVAVDAYGATRLGVEARTSINRKDFKVDFNVPLDGGKLLIGDKVDITLTIEAVKA
ncbi:YceI family protein [Microlunatus panaciterrae]|uniref:Polyisoprenoid-binding protein YceI n=1 Tax=Microlunatus panaciterrae TaxID=400768 RepID=A0ABS2RMH2_9ACTN|nr:YceI family protein [Microlunatus panaciterrae]MBM7799878.1 polyisoprenoid-binding protein YceI [Microlunatus panaciterrae]